MASNNFDTDSSADFNIDINDFKDITKLTNEIFYRVYDHKERELTISIAEINGFMIDRIEKYKSVPTNAEKLRFYTYCMILLTRAKNQSIEKKIDTEVIQIELAGEIISMSVGKWIKFFIEPTIDKIDGKIKLFESIKEMDDNYKIAKIKFAIDDYLSVNQTIHFFRVSIDLINVSENCPDAQKLTKSILELCDLLDCIGNEAFELALKNILLNY
jgi:hypothetical protein